VYQRDLNSLAEKTPEFKFPASFDKQYSITESKKRSVTIAATVPGPCASTHEMGCVGKPASLITVKTGGKLKF
jgi:hypothetical protein